MPGKKYIKVSTQNNQAAVITTCKQMQKVKDFVGQEKLHLLTWYYLKEQHSGGHSKHFCLFHHGKVQWEELFD